MRSIAAKLTSLALLATPAFSLPAAHPINNIGTASIPQAPGPSASGEGSAPSGSSSTPNIMFAPVNHPESNTDSTDPLKPKRKHVLWLAQINSALQDNMRRVDAAMLLQTNTSIVNLGATNLITGISCESDRLTIVFKNEDARNEVEEIWTKTVGTDGTQMFLDAYGEGCGKPNEMQFMQAKISKKDQKKTQRRQVPDAGNTATQANSLTYSYVDVATNKVVADLRAAWGEEHKHAIANCDGHAPGAYGSTTQKKRDIASMDPQELYSGDWPTMGSLNPVALRAASALQRRALISKSWDKKWDIDWRLMGDATAFGPGKIIFSDPKTNMTVSCVACGINGTLATSGAVSWGPFEGKKGNVLINPSMKGQIAIGIEVGKTFSAATGELMKELKKSFDFGFPGLEIPGILTLGPYASLEPFARAGLKTTGRLLIGGSLEWKSATAYFDLENSGNNKVEGWTPEAKPILEANAEISAEAAAGVRASINCGVHFAFLGIDVKKGVGVVNEAQIMAKASAGVSAFVDPNTGKLTTSLSPGRGKCDGINFSLSLSNRLYAEVNIISDKQIPFWAPAISIIPDVCWKYSDIAKFFGSNPGCTDGTNTCLKGGNTGTGTSTVDAPTAAPTVTEDSPPTAVAETVPTVAPSDVAPVARRRRTV